MDNETYVYQDAEVASDRTGVSVHAGFPNPAADRDNSKMTLSLNQLLVQHPSSTFFFRLHGRGWEEQGVFDGDIAVIDRAIRPRAEDLIVIWQEQGFTVTRFKQAPINITNFGVITSIIHEYRRGVVHEK
ncbi:MAG: S24 family peptidase [Candidatus Saccharimonadales bacterium]